MKTTNVLHSIAALNLEPIKNKLMDAEHGEGWSQAKADAMELEYRRFLHLMHKFPNESASPTKAVDTFWHYHILDTQKYAADCDDVFGCFMHHNPYGDEAGAEASVSGGDRMQELYEATFDDAYIRPEAYFMDHPASGTSAGKRHPSDLIRAKRGSAKAAICAARCHAMCMMVAKAAGAKAAICAARCHAMCMMSAAGAGAKGAANGAQRMAASASGA